MISKMEMLMPESDEKMLPSSNMNSAQRAHLMMTALVLKYNEIFLL